MIFGGFATHAPRRAAHYAIRGYQLSLSALMGRHCRHWPSCSDYTDEAIQRHGLWAGSWIGFARICRCGPGGTHGVDLVCEELPPDASWHTPWRYGRWRLVNAPEADLDSDVAPRPDDVSGAATGGRDRSRRPAD